MGMRVLLCAFAAGAMLVSCGLIPHRTARNEAGCPDLQSEGPQAHNPCVLKLMRGDVDERHRVPRARGQFQPTETDVPPVFVGLSISGGGSRAANFGTATLEQLDQMGVLKYVSAISTTSGGGLPGAYYALNGPSIDWKDARERMATNFLMKWAFRNVRPDKLLTTAFTHEDRSDLMADVFDEVLFNHATYGSLQKFGLGKPIFLANATHASSGLRFTFTQEALLSRQRAHLHSYPLSQAVMASAAFPGVFNSVTLKRYPGLMQPSRPGVGQRPPTPVGYDHLIDGGPADNLGIEALIALAASHQRARAKDLPAGDSQAPCFFFVIDAYPEGVPHRTGWDPDPRSVVSHAVDMNFLDAFDALLIQRRKNLLALLGLGGDAPGTGGAYIGDVLQRVQVDDLPDLLIGPGRQVVEVDIPRDISHDGRSALPIQRAEPCRLGECPTGTPPGKAPPPSPAYFRCTAWHINLSGLMTIRSHVGEPGQEPQRIPNSDAGLRHPVLLQRGRIQYVTNQIDTNFRLVGPHGCSPELLQNVLYAAAFIAVQEDHASRISTCNWFAAAGLPPSDKCSVFQGNRSMDVSFQLQSVAPRISERAGDTSVRCISF